MNRRLIGVLCILLSAFVFGFSPVIVALSYRGGNNGVNMALIRALVPLPALAILAGCTAKRYRMNFAQIRVCSLAGVMLFGCTLLLYSSYTYIPVGLATTLHFLYPLHVVLYETLFHHKRLGLWRGIGIVLDLVGIVLSAGMVERGGMDLRGFILALLSGYLYAAYILVLSYESRNPVPLYHLMLMVSLMGVPLCFCVGLLTNSLTINLTASAWGYAVLAALLVSIVGCVLFQKGVRYIGDADAAVYSLLEPISSIIFGFILMKEIPDQGALIGSAMIFAGLLCNAIGDRRQNA